MLLIKVRPARKGMGLKHPSAGELPDEGGLWPCEQFTCQRIEDGDIKIVPDDVDDNAKPAPAPKKEG